MKKLYIAIILIITNTFIYAQANTTIINNNIVTNSKNDLLYIGMDDTKAKICVALKILKCKGDKNAKSVTIKYRVFDISKSNVEEINEINLPNKGDYEIAKLRIVSPDPLLMGNYASFLPTDSYSSNLKAINHSLSKQNDYYLLVEGFKEFPDHLQKSDFEYIFLKLFSEKKDVVYKFYDLKDIKIKWK